MCLDWYPLAKRNLLLLLHLLFDSKAYRSLANVTSTQQSFYVLMLCHSVVCYPSPSFHVRVCAVSSEPVALTNWMNLRLLTGSSTVTPWLMIIWTLMLAASNSTTQLLPSRLPQMVREIWYVCMYEDLKLIYSRWFVLEVMHSFHGLFYNQHVPQSVERSFMLSRRRHRYGNQCWSCLRYQNSRKLAN